MVKESLNVIKKFLDKFEGKEYCLLSEIKGKSGFMMCLMWLHLVTKHNLKKPKKIYYTDNYPDEDIICVNFNDMDYTGNQRDAQMRRFFSKVRVKSKPDLKKITYVVIRVFNSERSILVFNRTKKYFIKRFGIEQDQNLQIVLVN